MSDVQRNIPLLFDRRSHVNTICFQFLMNGSPASFSRNKYCHVPAIHSGLDKTGVALYGRSVIYEELDLMTMRDRGGLFIYRCQGNAICQTRTEKGLAVKNGFYCGQEF